MPSALLMGVLLAVRALRSNLLRASLTILGLLIGVAAVIIVSGLASGAEEFLQGRMEAMGTNVLTIFPKTTDLNKPARLTEDDSRALARDAVTLVAVAPVISARITVISAENQAPTTVYGTTSAFFALRNWEPAKGDLWTSTEELTKAKVCVLGNTVARSLFGPDDPTGRTVRIGRHAYRVLGVLRTKGRDMNGISDMDDRIFMPIGTVRSRIATIPVGSISLIQASVQDPQLSTRAARQVESILRQRHHIPSGRLDVGIRNQKRLIDMRQTMFDTLAAFLVSVAAMSLLVGGIGVMNIMLVSVTERTREIGIRLAIGANQANVLYQFLAEAVALAAIGGGLGIVVGLVALTGFEAILGWPMKVTPSVILTGVGVSATTGIVFGFAPAHRASRLDPIDALRRD